MYLQITFLSLGIQHTKLKLLFFPCQKKKQTNKEKQNKSKIFCTSNLQNYFSHWHLGPYWFQQLSQSVPSPFSYTSIKHFCQETRTIKVLKRLPNSSPQADIPSKPRPSPENNPNTNVHLKVTVRWFQRRLSSTPCLIEHASKYEYFRT